MCLANRSLITIDNLSNGEMEALFSVADKMSESIGEQSRACQGKIMASLFFEPSTRTRLSFETAMHRLGGNVISAVDVRETSLAKGESIADMARVVGDYADIIVIRHPWEGAAQVVADYAGIPVINAGDGGHQHPTQTLCDLYTLQKERHTIKGLKIALWGDLKFGRTIHSLIFALAKFGANILFCPSPGLEVPEHILDKLSTEYGGEVERRKTLDYSTKSNRFPLNAIYITPGSPHQLAMMPDINIDVELKAGVDALYVTRPQKERFTNTETEQEPNQYPVVDKKLLNNKPFRKALVMHPLPRIDELAYELDADPRSMYFKQAAQGVPVRMALVALLLGVNKISIPAEDISYPPVDYPDYKQNFGVSCPNPRCVSTQVTEKKYIQPKFKIVSRKPLTLRCMYCEHGFEPRYVASSNWHDGRLDSKKYHSADSHWTGKIKLENLIIFDSEGEAEAHGFKPSNYKGGTSTKQ